jgi:chromosome partitioning protein
MTATIIAIYNAKGGEGKTTLSINTAAVAARAAHHGVCTRDLRTLVVELDPQGNASSGLGVQRDDPRKTIGAVLAGRVAVQDSWTATYLPNLRIISAARDLSRIEPMMEKDPHGIDRIAMALAGVSGDYDLILLDCSPGMGWLFRMAMRAAQGYVIPMRLEPFSLEGLSNCMEHMRLQRQQYELRAQMLGIALLGVDFRLQRHSNLIGDVRASYGPALFAEFVRQNEPVAEAPSRGMAVVDFKPRAWTRNSGARRITGS